MKNNLFIIIEVVKVGRKKVYLVFVVILVIIFLILGEFFMLFMLFLLKVEMIFMKGIYDNVRMVLMFGGVIFILFIWVCFVEKRFFLFIGFWKEKWMRKYLKGVLIGFVFILMLVILLLLLGSVKL